MYYSSIETGPAEPGMAPDSETSTVTATALDRVIALMLVLALPVLAMALLVRLVWRDAGFVIRGLRVCYRTYAKELARRD